MKKYYRAFRRLLLPIALLGLVAATVFGYRVPVVRATFGTIEITDSAGAAVTTLSPGAGMYVTVTDANRNTSASTAEQITATVASTNAADLETFTGSTILK